MYEYPGECIKVTDGDTLHLRIDLGFGIKKIDKFRLYDVDTPEIYRPRNKAELQHGQEAKEFVEDELFYENAKT